MNLQEKQHKSTQQNVTIRVYGPKPARAVSHVDPKTVDQLVEMEERNVAAEKLVNVPHRAVFLQRRPPVTTAEQWPTMTPSNT